LGDSIIELFEIRLSLGITDGSELFRGVDSDNDDTSEDGDDTDDKKNLQ